MGIIQLLAGHKTIICIGISTGTVAMEEITQLYHTKERRGERGEKCVEKIYCFTKCSMDVVEGPRR